MPSAPSSDVCIEALPREARRVDAVGPHGELSFAQETKTCGIEMIGVLVGDDCAGRRSERIVGAVRQRDERIRPAAAAEQLESRHRAGRGKHGIDDQSVTADFEQEGGVPQLEQSHAATMAMRPTTRHRRERMAAIHPWRDGDLPWDLFRTFEVVARLGSFTAASKTLGISQSRCGWSFTARSGIFRRSGP